MAVCVCVMAVCVRVRVRVRVRPRAEQVSLEVGGGLAPNLAIASPYRKSRRTPSHEAIDAIAGAAAAEQGSAPRVLVGSAAGGRACNPCNTHVLRAKLATLGHALRPPARSPAGKCRVVHMPPPAPMGPPLGPETATDVLSQGDKFECTTEHRHRLRRISEEFPFTVGMLHTGSSTNAAINSFQ